MKIIFMGTPDFAVGTLRSLAEAGHEITLVVSQPDKPKGLAMGAAAHAMGTARAMELGAVEGAISGLAIGLMGVATAVLVPILEKII